MNETTETTTPPAEPEKKPCLPAPAAKKVRLIMPGWAIFFHVVAALLWALVLILAFRGFVDPTAYVDDESLMTAAIVALFLHFFASLLTWAYNLLLHIAEIGRKLG